MRCYRIKEEKYLDKTLFYPQFKNSMTVQDVLEFKWNGEWNFFNTLDGPERFGIYTDALDRIDADRLELRKGTPIITYIDL